MKRIFLYLPIPIALIAVFAFAWPFWPTINTASGRPEVAIWTRIDDTTISLYGPIDKGDYSEKFLPVFDDKVTTVLLDSGGGEVFDGLAIGQALLAQGVDVRVTGLCLSSCANYLFTAGKTKSIELGGVVGFHGNLNAVVKEAGGIEKVLPRYLRWIPGGDYNANVRELEKNAIAEAVFFKQLNIPQSFFDLTQSPNKGEGQGQVFGFLFPTPETFEEIGIHNIEGEQSLEIIAWMEDVSGTKMLNK